MRRLYFDTETSGFINKKLANDDKKQAWIVQIGFIYEVDNNILNQGCFLINSEGRIIHPGAQKVHKISTELTDLYGISEKYIADILKYFLFNSDLIVGHNISFDLDMLKMLLARNGYLISDDIYLKIPIICTMKASTNLCKLPGKYGYKWPKLTELYDFLFQESFPAHDALEDIKATRRCYKTLIDKDIIKENT